MAASADCVIYLAVMSLCFTRNVLQTEMEASSKALVLDQWES